MLIRDVKLVSIRPLFCADDHTLIYASYEFLPRILSFTESPVGPFQPLPRRPFVLFYGSFDNNSKRSQQQPPPASTGEVLSRHDFSQKVYFLKPTLCLHCKDYIYGNGFRGVQCKSEYNSLHLLQYGVENLTVYYRTLERMLGGETLKIMGARRAEKNAAPIILVIVVNNNCLIKSCPFSWGLRFHSKTSLLVVKGD